MREGGKVSVGGLWLLCRAPGRKMKPVCFLLRYFAAESRVRDALGDLLLLVMEGKIRHEI